MIISCPHCQTKYQVTYEAIGSAGRKVQCAHCQQAWDQGPIEPDEPPPAIRQAEQALAEDALDDALSAEEKVATAAVGKPGKEKATKPKKTKKDDLEDDQSRGQSAAGRLDPAVVRKRRKAFSREESVSEEQPVERLRLALRIIWGVALVAVLAYAYWGRVQVVQRFPAMAGIYEAVGLQINVVGLDFSNVSSMQTLRNGKEVLIVSAQIVGLSPIPVPVPSVVVTLIGPNGQGIYQWSVRPAVRDLMIGERSTFETQLTLPPGEASRVRLSFAGGARLTGNTARSAGASTRPGAAGQSDPGAAAALPTANPEHR